MFAVAGMVYGWTSRGRVHRVYVWGAAGSMDHLRASPTTTPSMTRRDLNFEIDVMNADGSDQRGLTTYAGGRSVP